MVYLTLDFASRSSNIWLPFQAKNNIKKSLLALHLTTKDIMRVPQIVTYALSEKGMEYKGEKMWALVEPWCKQWSCSGWQKGTSPDEVMLNSEEIKPVAIAIIKLHLSERTSKGVSESVSQSVENSTKYRILKIS